MHQVRHSYQHRYIQGVLRTQQCCLLPLRLCLSIGILATCAISLYVWLDSDIHFDFYFGIEWTQILWILTLASSFVCLFGLYRGNTRFLRISFWVLFLNTSIIAVYYGIHILRVMKDEQARDAKHVRIVITYFVDVTLRLLVMGSLSKAIQMIEMIKTAMPAQTRSSVSSSISRPSTI